MSEESWLSQSQAVVTATGVSDELKAVGEFYPRGHIGGLFIGGLIGGAAGDAFGSAGELVGDAAGAMIGMHAADKASGLPSRVFVAVSDSAIYLLDGEFEPRAEPHQVIGALKRSDVTVKVHQRVNVRVVELLDANGSKVELEGARMPMFHVGDVLDVLQG